MRTEQEIRRAAKLFAWYVGSERIHRQVPETVQNIVGVDAALRWMLGEPIDAIDGTLLDIDDMQRADSHKAN